MARNNIRLVVLLVFLSLILGGAWYWDQRPSHVQAAIADVRTATKQTDVMTVEAVTEDGPSAVGRQIAIRNARVTKMANERTFWVVGSEGDPLLVVIGHVPSALPKLASGERVSLTGVVRDDATGTSLDAKERAELAKTDMYLLASDVQLVR